MDVPGIKRGDEVGELARATMIFKEMGLEKQRLEQQQEKNEHRAAEERQAFMRNLADGFEKAVGNIVKSVSAAAVNMKQTALRLTHLSESTGQQCGIVATASGHSSSNIISVAAAAEQLSASLAEIDKQISSTSQKTNVAVEEIAVTNQSIDELMAAVGRIGRVIEIINRSPRRLTCLHLTRALKRQGPGRLARGLPWSPPK